MDETIMDETTSFQDFIDINESLTLTVEQEFRLALAREEIKGYHMEDLQDQYLTLYRLFLMKSNLLEKMLKYKVSEING